jgi:hypothetical protein
MIKGIKTFFGKRPGYGFILLIFVAMVIFTTVQERQAENKIEKNLVYVVGKIVNIRSRRGTSIEYEYDFNHQTYHSSEGMHVKYEYIGARFLVKINSKAPSDSRLLAKYFISDSMSLRQPDSGWTINPINNVHEINQ